MENEFHIPALLVESIEGLAIKSDGIYADVTFGGGGHSKEILKKLDKGKLIAFDQDQEAKKNAINIKNNYKEKFIFHQCNFRYLRNFIKFSGYEKIDGIIADLGVSSRQFNDKERGFSFRLGGKPDMRMNKNLKFSALDILNQYSSEQLSDIFRIYGEIKSSNKLANAIVIERDIESLEQLNDIITKTIITKKDFKILARVYQALRIEVNKEIESLKDFLVQSAQILKPGGRLVVISYHSLEDRIVKNFFKYGNFRGEPEKDIFGNPKKEFTEIHKKAIVPSENEIKLNNRARSAKLRTAEKN